MSHDEHSGSHVNYVVIFFALCGLTALSVLSDIFRPSSQAALIVVVLAIAAAKATCVLLFFMHLKFEGNWKYVLLAPTTILAIGLPLALLPDIGLHYYVNSAPQALAQQADQDEESEAAAPEEVHEGH